MRRRVWGAAAAVLLIAAGTALAQAPPAASPDSAVGRGAEDAKQTARAKAASKTAAAPPAKATAAPGTQLRVKKAVLGVRHRAIHEFYDEMTVKVGEEFSVGDTRYTAKVLRFLPDFVIDMKTRKVFSATDRPDNPAMQIATWEKGAPHDTSWAFLNFPPHFSKRSLLAFQIVRIEFENHAPITMKHAPKVDTTSAESRKR